MHRNPHTDAGGGVPISLEAERSVRRPRPITPADAVGYLDLVEVFVHQALEILDSDDETDVVNPFEALGPVAAASEVLAACLPLLRVTHPSAHARGSEDES